MDFSDSTNISNKLNDMNLKNKKRNRHPLQEKNYSSKQKRNLDTYYTNIGDYTFQNNNVNEKYEPRLSKYNGLRVYSDVHHDESFDESFQNECSIEQQYGDRNLWAKPKSNTNSNDFDVRKGKFKNKAGNSKDEIFYNDSKNKILNSAKKNKHRKNIENDDVYDNARIIPEFSYNKKKNYKYDENFNNINDDFLSDSNSNDKEEKTLHKLQKELNALKKKQSDVLSNKENIVSIIKREVEKARCNIEKEKNIEIELLTKNYENEIKTKDANFKEFRVKTKELILQYKDACISKVRTERGEYNRKFDLFKSDYEIRLKKYRNAYLALKERYKREILNLYNEK